MVPNHRSTLWRCVPSAGICSSSLTAASRLMVRLVGQDSKPEDLKHRLGARTQALKVDVPVARW